MTIASGNKNQLVICFHLIQGDLLHLLTSKLKSADEAEDLLQDIYIKVAELDVGIVDKIDEPKSYLFRIAHNVAIDYLRKRNRHSKHFADVDQADLENSEITALQPDRVLEGQQQAARLRMALTNMPSKRRQAFLLFKYRGLSRVQIATELDLTVEAVEKHIVRALKDCRDYLTREDA